MKNILITGSGGFVGKQVLNQLEETKHNISVISSKNSKFFSNYKNVKRIINSKDLFLQEESWFRKCLKNVDIVIHLAWYANPEDYLFNIKNIECLEGTLKLAKAFSKSKAKRFIGIGTCIEYKNSNKPLSSSSPLDPKSLYASCKSAAYFSLRSLIKDSNKEFAWCRLFYMFGEGQSSEKLHGYILDRIKKNSIVELSSGEQKKDYTDVKFAAKEIIKVSLSNYQGAYNICSGEGKSVKEIALEIAKQNGGEHLLRFGAKESSDLDQLDIIGVKDFISS